MFGWGAVGERCVGEFSTLLNEPHALSTFYGSFIPAKFPAPHKGLTALPHTDAAEPRNSEGCAQRPPPTPLPSVPFPAATQAPCREGYEEPGQHGGQLPAAELPVPGAQLPQEQLGLRRGHGARSPQRGPAAGKAPRAPTRPCARGSGSGSTWEKRDRPGAAAAVSAGSGQGKRDGKRARGRSAG